MIEKMRKLAEKKYYFILHTLLLALVFSVSATISVSIGLNRISTSEIKAEYNAEVGCTIESYELVCSEEYYEFGTLIIDLSGDEVSVITGSTILTKDRILSNGLDFSYDDFLAKIGHDDSYFDIDDAIEYYESGIKTAILYFTFALTLIGVWIGHLIFNLLRTVVNKLLINNFLGKYPNYSNVYRITIIALTPLVLLNGVTRAFTGTTIVNLISGSLPGIGWIVSFVLNSAIIFGITYLMLKKDNEETDYELDNEEKKEEMI